MQNWIYVTTFENWVITDKTGIIGIPQKNKKLIERLKRGDVLIIYCKAGKYLEYKTKSCIVASAEIISDPFFDNQILFNEQKNSDETFPCRAKIKIQIKFERPKLFKYFVPYLEFIKNKIKWGTIFFGRSLIEISEIDYNTLISK